VIYLELCWELGCRELGKLDNYRTVKQQAEDKHTFVASDYYGDCTKSLLEVTIVLLTQSSLLVFYVLGLYTGETPDFSNGRVFAFYYAGSRVCTRPHYRTVSYTHSMCQHVLAHAEDMHMHYTCTSHAHITRACTSQCTRTRTYDRTWSRPLCVALQAVPFKQSSYSTTNYLIILLQSGDSGDSRLGGSPTITMQSAEGRRERRHANCRRPAGIYVYLDQAQLTSSALPS